MSDSIQIDSAQLAAWQHDPRYAYDRELVGGSQNLLEWLSETISEWLKNTFDVVMDNNVVYYSLIFLGVALAAFLGWIVWKRNPQLFMKKEEEGVDYDVEEDTIYGVDFDSEIRQALAAQDYRQAVRLLYLQTLKHLSDQGRINWQPSKTPMQYMRELELPAFSELSRHFIRVRYGNFGATEALFREMESLQREVKGGDA
jgi:hypothetical protein